MDSELLTLSAKHDVALRERFGALLTSEDLAEVLRYSSHQALLKARTRGVLPVRMVQLPQRRGWFASVASVAELLAKLDIEAMPPREDPMT